MLTSAFHALPRLLLAALLAMTQCPLEASAQRSRSPRATPPPVPPACTDFYQDTHRDWLAAHPPRYGMAPVSALGELQQHVLEQQYEVLNQASTDARNDAQRALARLWTSGLDETAIETAGLSAIAPLITQIAAIRRPREIAQILSTLHALGLEAGFSFHAGADPDGSGRLMGTFSEGALGLPDPDYYLREDEDTRQLLAHYTMYVQAILQLTGTPEEQLRAQMEQVIHLETRLARLARKWPQMPAHRLDDAIPEEALPETTEAPLPVPVHAQVSDLVKHYRALQLQDFFTQHGIGPDAQVVISNPALLPGLNRLVASLKPGQWSTYLRFHLAHALAPYLPRAFAEAHSAFYGHILRGEHTPPTQASRVLTAVNRTMGQVLAREYLQRYLAPDTRSAAAEIAANIRTRLEHSLKTNPWMSLTAQREALATLSALKIEIAAPQGLDEDGSLPDFGDGSFAHLMLESSRWRMQQEMRRIGRLDDTAQRWQVLPQQPVLAYDPDLNRLIVSAAVLQAPIFGHTTPARYGGYGALIGRELSRALILNGPPPEGWTLADTHAITAKRAQLATQYSAWPWPESTDPHVNSERSADETLADLAGVELAHAALHASPSEPEAGRDDLFFRAWAGLWREQMGPETAAYTALTSPHAPGPWRSNGPQLFTAFA